MLITPRHRFVGIFRVSRNKDAPIPQRLVDAHLLIRLHENPLSFHACASPGGLAVLASSWKSLPKCSPELAPSISKSQMCSRKPGINDPACPLPIIFDAPLKAFVASLIVNDDGILSLPFY